MLRFDAGMSNDSWNNDNMGICDYDGASRIQARSSSLRFRRYWEATWASYYLFGSWIKVGVFSLQHGNGPRSSLVLMDINMSMPLGFGLAHRIYP